MADQELRLTVTGMTCPRCEARVEKALLTHRGVSYAKADHQQNTCAVRFDPEAIATEGLARLVTEAGYTAALP
ncbi:MAG: heavy metal-associated domain-containing protein [Nitrospirota bacterium]|jgi:copper chaperone CopZ